MLLTHGMITRFTAEGTPEDALECAIYCKDNNKICYDSEVER